MSQVSRDSAIGALTTGYTDAVLTTHVRLVGVGRASDKGLASMASSNWWRAFSAEFDASFR